MIKRQGLLLFSIFCFQIQAQVIVPDSVRDQIITDVMSQKGRYDAAEIELRVREWQLEQPQPKASGELTDSGSCVDDCTQTGGDENFPAPRNVTFKGKIKDGKHTQNLIIKWKRPQALPDDSNWFLKQYKVILSKDGTTYEKYKVKAKYKNNGKPKKHQKLKLRGLTVGDYEVQVRAIYKQEETTTNLKSSGLKSSASANSPWSVESGVATSAPDFLTVGGLDHSTALYQCLINGALASDNGAKALVDDNTFLADVFFLPCEGGGLVNADITQMTDLIGLNELDITNNPLVTDITPLGTMVLLEKLTISQNPQINVADLEIQKNYFDSLHTLIAQHMGWVTIPEFPEDVTYIDLSKNSIAHNVSNYFPSYPVETLILDDNSDSFDAIGEPTGNKTLNDAFFTALATNEITTIVARRASVTDIDVMSAIIGLENLDLSESDLSGEQNLDDFSGFCALTIQDTDLGTLIPARPVQFLNLDNNPVMKKMKPAEHDQYRPVVTSFIDSDAVYCHQYHTQIITNTAPALLDMSTVPFFVLGNGQDRELLGCDVAKPSSIELNAAAQCKPNRVDFVKVYEDDPSNKRYITWQPKSQHDHTLWGATHYLITAYEDSQVINQYTSLLTEPTFVQEDDDRADRYEIQVCIGSNCGYAKGDDSFEQGLAVPNITDVSWNGEDSFQIHFDYVSNAPLEAQPTRFEIWSTFPQSDGTYLVNTVNVTPGDPTIGLVTTAIPRRTVMGNGFNIRACRDYMGCSHFDSVAITVPHVEPPTGQLPIVTNVQANPDAQQENILLTWDYVNGTEMNLNMVDYIKITEQQPYIREGSIATPTSSQPGLTSNNGNVLVFYSHNIEKESMLLSRFVKGNYDYTVQACRDLDGVESCSQEMNYSNTGDNQGSTEIINDLGRADLSLDAIIIDVEASDICLGPGDCNVEGGPLAEDIDVLKWSLPLSGQAIDYFLVKSVPGFENAGGFQNVPMCVTERKSPNLGGTTDFEITEFKVDSSAKQIFSSRRNWNTKQVCKDLIVENHDPGQPAENLGKWSVSACVNGVGCGLPAFYTCTDGLCAEELPNNSHQLQPGTFGPGDLKPGSYWNPALDGTGWHFYWANGLHQTVQDGRYGRAYDLVGYWFAYALDEVNNVWTPVWYEARLREAHLQNDATVLQGNLYFHKKGADIEELDVGNVQLKLSCDAEECHQQHAEKDATLILDLDYSNNFFHADGNSDNIHPYTPGENGHLELVIHDIAIDVLGTGNDSFITHNDNDHYSGLWQMGVTDPNAAPLSSADMSMLSWIEGGLENNLFAYHDAAGMPVWLISQSCPQNNIQPGTACDGAVSTNSGDVPPANYFAEFEPESQGLTDTLYTMDKGYNPIGQVRLDWARDALRTYVGDYGRAFETDVNDTAFKEAKFWIDVDGNISHRNIQVQHGVPNSSDPSDMVSLEKKANLHGIFFDIVELEDISLSTCDANAIGTCRVLLSWYTDDDFEITPYISKDNGPYQELQGTGIPGMSLECPNGIETDAYQSTVECTFADGGDYQLQLHKPKYPVDEANGTEVIAESNTLTIIACAPGENCSPAEIPVPNNAITNADLWSVTDYPNEAIHQAGVGPVPGSAGVSGGSATYHLPLVVPPGINGMTPDLSVNYSSKGGNGILGVGWSVSSGSSVHRCPKTVAQDGLYQSVKFLPQDRACLDGQRLILISGIDNGDASSDGRYWASNAEYRTELDSFAKITYDGTDFTVQAKSGRTRVYSQTGGSHNPWLIQQETDAHNNSIVYVYATETENLGANEQVLSEIYYTGVGASTGNRKIVFGYGDRIVNGQSDYSKRYQFGKEFETTRRLESITTWVDSSWQRRYDFIPDISATSGYLLLDRVEESVPGEPARVLFESTWSSGDWQASGDGFEYNNLTQAIDDHFESAGPVPDNISNIQVGLDYNGDGIKELIYGPQNQQQNQDAGIIFLGQDGQVQKILDQPAAKYASHFGVGDLNADGINDLISMDIDHNNNSFQLMFYVYDHNKLISDASSDFNDYFDPVPINVTLDDGLFDTDGNGEVDDQWWGIDNLNKLNVDPEASEYYLRDYDNDGYDDLMVLVQLKEDAANDGTWSGQDRWTIKNKLLFFKNISTWSHNTTTDITTFVLNFAAPDVVLDNLEPKFEREDEPGGISMYLYDDIGFIEDFNGDGLMDIHTKRIVKYGLLNSDPDAPLIPEITHQRIYFTPALGQTPVARTFAQLGLDDFRCTPYGEGANTEVLCDQYNTSDSPFGPNSFTFQDVNGDGLKDLLYFDRGIQTEDAEGNMQINPNIHRYWKVRLNEGGAYDQAIFDNTTSIESTFPAGAEDVQHFLPQGNVCKNLDHTYPKELYRICNPVFRGGMKQADLNADGLIELLYPDYKQLMFNRCLTSSGGNRMSENLYCDETDDACITGASMTLMQVLEQAAMNPFVNDEMIQYMDNNDELLFGSDGASCLISNCSNDPQDPQFTPETNTTYSQFAVNTMCSSVDDGHANIDLYDEAGGYNALWDRGVYGYASLSFEVTADGTLQVNEQTDTGIFSTLFWGGAGDLSGDGLSDFSGPVGCIREPQGIELLGCDGSETNTTILPSGLVETDLIQDYGSSLLIKETNEMPDMLSQINVPATGQWYEWDYAPISKELAGRDEGFRLYSLPERDHCDEGSCPDGYLAEAGAEGTHFYFNSSMYVVAQMRQSTGLFNGANEVVSSSEYAYQEAVYNNQGRGFQGFRKISVLNKPDMGNMLNMTLSESTFSQVFPHAGQLDLVKTYQYEDASTKHLLSEIEYEWYAGDLTHESNHDVFNRPLRVELSKQYAIHPDTKASSLYAESSTEYVCGTDGDGYDGYGNVLCSKQSVVTHTMTDNGEHTTTNRVNTTNTYAIDQVSNWWVDKLTQSSVEQQRIESGGGMGVQPYDEKNTTNLFHWVIGNSRELACQYTMGNGASPAQYAHCLSPIDNANVMRNSFTYDGFGRVTSLNQFAQVRNPDGSYAEQTRETHTQYGLGDVNKYFPHVITQGSEPNQLSTITTYDAGTGQMLTSTDANGVVTSSVYDPFGFQTQQQTVIDADVLAQPVTTAMQSCAGGACDQANAIISNAMDDVATQVNSLIDQEISFNTGFFFRGAGAHRAPRLSFKTQTRQEGVSVVTNWLDQRGQVVLTQTHHAAGDTNTAGSTYALSLTNPLGQTELVTSPFVVSGTDAQDVYFTFTMHNELGQLQERLQRLGDLDDVDINENDDCWRQTKYVTDQGQTTVTANIIGANCTADKTALVMYRSYDAAGVLRETVTPLVVNAGGDEPPQTTQYWYDAAGNPAIVKDAAGHQITTQFDDLGRKTQVNDPNMGTKTFVYNGYGEVIYEQDAEQLTNSLANHLFYDELGRLVQQRWNVNSALEPVGGHLAYLDVHSYGGCGSQMALCSQLRSTSTAFGDSFSLVQEKGYWYDSFGRLVEQSVELVNPTENISSLHISDPVYSVYYSYYDDHNLVRQTTYGRSGIREDGDTFYAVVNEYNQFGDLIRQMRNAEGFPELMRIDTLDDFGRVTGETHMNEFNTFMNYYPGTGQVKSINHEAGTQVFDYAYDAWGNITSQRLNGTHTERFSYDELQRLRSASINNGTPTHYEYSIDGLGNLVHKSDYANTQSYDATGNAGPNAITSAVLNSGGTMTYAYDKKGNRISDTHSANGQTLHFYDANNLLVRSAHDSNQVNYRYGVDQARYLKHEVSNDPNDGGLVKQELTLYGLPGFEEVIELSTLTNQQLKVQVTSNVQVTLRTGINRFEHHTMLKDRLGSTSLIFDDQAAVVATKGYDAFGKPRDGDTWAAMTNPALDFDQNDAEAIDVSKRGFTGHEHIDAFELIHMNGRMYDFNNGRFLSVDPFIQGTNSQAINPYSYIHNNPLSGVDPTGYYIVRENCDIVSSNCSKASVTIKDMVDGMTGETDNGHAERFTLQAAGADKIGDSLTLADLQNQASSSKKGEVKLLPIELEPENQNLMACVGYHCMWEHLSPITGSKLGDQAMAVYAEKKFEDIMSQNPVGQLALCYPDCEVTDYISAGLGVAPFGVTRGVGPLRYLGRVQSRINVPLGRTRFTPLRQTGQPVSAGYTHVVNSHFNRPISRNISVFTIKPSELKRILQSKRVVNSPVTQIQGGQYVRTVDVGRTVGLTNGKAGGVPTSRITVFTDEAGNLITAFPVK